MQCEQSKGLLPGDAQGLQSPCPGHARLSSRHQKEAWGSFLSPTCRPVSLPATWAQPCPQSSPAPSPTGHPQESSSGYSAALQGPLTH